MQTKYIFLPLFFISFVFSGIVNYNSIYQASNSSYNNSVGGSHLLARNVNGVFNQLIALDGNIKNNLYYSNSKYFNNTFDVMQLGYCIKHSFKKNISVGFVKRSILDNYNTLSSWNYDDDGPSFDEIDYSEINNFSDNEIGFLFSLASRINDHSSFGVKLKSTFHKIDNAKGYGFGVDFIFHNRMNQTDFVIGLEDIFAFKKWQSGINESFKSIGYISISKKINNFLFAYEYDSYAGNIYSLDIEVYRNIFFRTGYNKINNIVAGFGIKTEYVELNYAYLKSEGLIGYTNQFSLIFNLARI